MPELRDRHEGGAARHPPRARPVVLATLSVRVDPSAERMAIDSALEAGVPLVIANLLPLPPYPTTFALVGPEGLNLPHEEDLEAVRATAKRAAELGVDTKLLRVTTRRPVKAMLEVVSDVDAGLLVFGPDLRLTSRLRFRLVARRVRREARLPGVGRPGRMSDPATALPVDTRSRTRYKSSVQTCTTNVPTREREWRTRRGAASPSGDSATSGIGGYAPRARAALLHRRRRPTIAAVAGDRGVHAHQHVAVADQLDGEVAAQRPAVAGARQRHAQRHEAALRAM